MGFVGGRRGATLMRLMDSPFPILAERLGDQARWVHEAVKATEASRRELPVFFPQLPRRLSREALGGGVSTVGPARCDLDGWRRCDAGAALLLVGAKATPAELLDLYAHGDLEERAMLLRSLALLPPDSAMADLLGEVQRTNMVLHVEAAVLDSDLLARAGTHEGKGLPGFGQAEANNLMLKIAFLDLPMDRVFAAERLANEELSRMLQDLATEREAAGRAIWRDTDRMICHAPVPGTIARILGGLEHGDDGRRLSAAHALAQCNRKDLQAFAEERLPREPRENVRAILQRLLD